MQLKETQNQETDEERVREMGMKYYLSFVYK